MVIQACKRHCINDPVDLFLVELDEFLERLFGIPDKGVDLLSIR